MLKGILDFGNMKVILGKQGSGKTTELIKMAAEGRYYIVCRNYNHARHIQQMALEMGVVILFPISYDEFLNRQYNGVHIDGFLIDDADALLQRLSPVRITAITLTNENQSE